MKVIDLIDIKEKPKHIKINGDDFYLNENSFSFEEWYLDGNGNSWYDDYYLVLGDKVELIEDKPKKIEPWGEIPLEELRDKKLDIEELQTYLKTVMHTQNELIKGLNYLLEKSDKDE